MDISNLKKAEKVLSFKETIIINGIKTFFRRLNFIINKPYKESIFSVFFLRIKGSLSIEASLAVPLFLFFVMTIMMSIGITDLESKIIMSMHQGFCLSYDSGISEEGFSYLRECYERNEHPYLYIKNERDGLELYNLSKDLEGIIDYEAEYGIKTFIDLIPMGEIGFKNEIFAHSFTGYSLSNEDLKLEEEELVYVTKTGSKYHRSLNCTHINIKTMMVPGDEIAAKRNVHRERYHPCERCRPFGSSNVFITEDGNRYHSTPDCLSLKRTVDLVLLKEAVADGYTPCSKCG